MRSPDIVYEASLSVAVERTNLVLCGTDLDRQGRKNKRLTDNFTARCVLSRGGRVQKNGGPDDRVRLALIYPLLYPFH